MKIGIVGKGKMGLDIFHYFFEQECQLVLIVRKEEDIKDVTIKLKKKLDRMEKRGIISEEQFLNRLNSFVIDTNYEQLRACALVIETVLEDILVKQATVRTIEEQVSDTCLIVSNSSSLDLDEIFQECKIKGRCLGLHFFFPVKYLEYVEINKANCTEKQCAASLMQIMQQLGKKGLILEKKGNYFLSRIITLIVSYSYLLYCEGTMPIQRIDQIVKNEFMMFGPFEMVDSTGLVIIDQCTESFLSYRYHKMLKNIGDEVKLALKNGYSGGINEKGFVLFEKEKRESALDFCCQDGLNTDIYINRLKAIVCNEISYLHNSKCIDGVEGMKAVEEVLGLSEKIKDMFLGIRDQIEKILYEDYEKYKIPCMKVEDFSLFID